MCVNAREFLYTNTLRIARRGKGASERERMAEREGRRCVSACSGIINAPFCLLSPCFLFNYAMSRTRLAVNWFNYPICLWQAWFQPNCSSCGRRWQTAMWRRRTARPITVTGVWTCRPPPPFPSKTTTSMDPPTASTSATRSRERGKITQPLTWEFGRIGEEFACRFWFLGQSEHSLRHCWNLLLNCLYVFSWTVFLGSLSKANKLSQCHYWRWKSLPEKPSWWTGTNRAFPANES